MEKKPRFCEVPSQSGLFLSLLVRCLLSTPLAVLLQFNFARDKLAILARPIIDAPALGACHFYQLILRHARHYTARRADAQQKEWLCLAYLVPWSELCLRINESPHQRIYHDPCHQNDNKADNDIYKDCFRFFHLAWVCDIREI